MNNKRLKFYLTDFCPMNVALTFERATECAQKRYDLWLEQQAVVFADGRDKPWHNISFQGNTHKAYLIDAQEIEPCKHEPEKIKWESQVYDYSGPFNGAPKLSKYEPSYKCQCGATVKPSSYERVE